MVYYSGVAKSDLRDILKELATWDGYIIYDTDLFNNVYINKIINNYLTAF